MWELGQGMQPRETGLDRRGEAWGDYDGPDAPRPSVQELFARTRKGLATPRQGRVRRPDAIGFALDRRGFWLLCAGGVVAMILVFLAGFLAGLGTNIDPSETASVPIAEVPMIDGAAPRRFDPSLSSPAPASTPPRDPRLAELGPVPLPQNTIPAVPADPPAQPMLSPLAVQGVRQALPGPEGELDPSPPPAAAAPVPVVEAAPLAPPASAPAPPPVQAAPAPAITAPPARTGDWVLQFGVFRGQGNAERLAASLRGRVEGVRVQSATGPSGTALFHVWSGGFPDREAAAAEAARLKAAHGLDAFATRP